MKVELLNIENKVLGEVTLNDSVFGLNPRVDIIKRVIDWQRTKNRRGTSSVKTVGEVSGTTKKPFKQIGMGKARQGNARGVQRRGGGIAHGPQLRDYNDVKLQKKIRSLGLKHALSLKKLKNALHVIDSMHLGQPKTALLARYLSNFGSGKIFMIDGLAIDNNLKLSIASLNNVNAVPAVGANVYSIISSNHVLISKHALILLEGRLK